MSIALNNNYINSNYSGNSTVQTSAKVPQSTEGESVTFDRELSNMKSKTSGSFVTPITEEDVRRIWDEKVQANQNKKMTIYEMLAVRPFAKELMYYFEGSSRLYTFDEYVKEMEKQVKAADELGVYGD